MKWLKDLLEGENRTRTREEWVALGVTVVGWWMCLSAALYFLGAFRGVAGFSYDLISSLIRGAEQSVVSRKFVDVLPVLFGSFFACLLQVAQLWVGRQLIKRNEKGRRGAIILNLMSVLVSIVMWLSGTITDLYQGDTYFLTLPSLFSIGISLVTIYFFRLPEVHAEFKSHNASNETVA